MPADPAHKICMRADHRTRVKKGVSTGGQFAAENRPEAGVQLGSPDPWAAPSESIQESATAHFSLHEQYGIGADHPHIDTFNQLEGLRTASASILEEYPHATSMTLIQNLDGENQWDIVKVTDKDGKQVGDPDEIMELGVDNEKLGDVGGGVWQLDKDYPETGDAGVMDRGRPNDFATMTIDLKAAARPRISSRLTDAPPVVPASQDKINDALADAGIKNGHAFAISGAGYDRELEVAHIDLSNDEGTGGTLFHDYRSGETRWEWEDQWMGEGSSEDVDIAVEDITREPGTAKEVFDRFRSGLE